MDYDFKFSQQEVALIGGPAELPYKVSVPLLGKIQRAVSAAEAAAKKPASHGENVVDSVISEHEFA